MTDMDNPPGMPLTAQGRIMQVEKGRTLLYISRKLVADSAWPFTPGERVLITIDPRTKRLTVERAPPKATRKP